MSLTGGLAVYFILWWLAFIAVLPFGVRTVEETGEHQPGHAQSAPSRPLLVRKVAAASVIAAIVWVTAYVVIARTGLTLDDFSFAAPPNG